MQQYYLQSLLKLITRFIYSAGIVVISIGSAIIFTSVFISYLTIPVFKQLTYLPLPICSLLIKYHNILMIKPTTWWIKGQYLFTWIRDWVKHYSIEHLTLIVTYTIWPWISSKWIDS